MTENTTNTPVEGNKPTTANTPVPSAQKKRKKWPIVVGVIAAIIIVAGIGMFVWHEQPSFCGTVCHTPMSDYVESYNQEINTPEQMLSSVHRMVNYDCLDCHVPDLSQQVNEGMHWVAGDYDFDYDTQRLISRSDEYGTAEFCLREGCHSDYTVDTLNTATSDFAFNPHDWSQHGYVSCGTCHQAHGTSEMYCGSCHLQVQDELPVGWVMPAYAGVD